MKKSLIWMKFIRAISKRIFSYLLKIEKTEAFSKMLKLLGSQTAGLLNYSQLATDAGISLPTLKHYLWYAEKTFILRQITPYFRNKLKEIVKSPVLYFYDIGFRNYMIGYFGNLRNPVELGHVFQNLIFNILQEKLKYTSATIQFWRTIDRAEVDFVITRGEELMPIEVKFSELKKCEIGKSLHNFIEKYSPATAMIVNLSLETEIKVKDSTVKFIPFYKLITDFAF